MSNLPRIIVDVVLFCPHCGVRHVGESRNGEKWHRRAHTTHRCQACGGGFDVYASGQALDAPAGAGAKVPELPSTAPAWLVDHLLQVQVDAFNQTNIGPDFILTCSAEFGLRIGIAPGDAVRIVGPIGGIIIKSRLTPVEVNNK